MKRVLWALALFGLLVLGGAAVWMGGLNQDEGWYLYAASLVSEGRLPYRDFAYTQGPLMPVVYAAFAWVWRSWGLLGARLFTLLIGVASVAMAALLAGRLVSERSRGKAALTTVFLLGCNLYHLYYVTIPKTYALAGLFVTLGFYLLAVATAGRWRMAVLSGLALAFAAGTRISLGALLAVVGMWLLCRRNWHTLACFCAGGFLGLALVYGPFLLVPGAREGLVAAQAYHAARGGFDIVWLVGSLSRLVRWYLPVFIVLGLGLVNVCVQRSRNENMLLIFGFLAVFGVQMLAPFPYEDYQVPVMGLLAVYAATAIAERNPSHENPHWRVPSRMALVMVAGLAYATAFGSPLLEQWKTNGADRFWSLKKPKTELAQLRDVARRIEALDPGGRELLTQDLYLAVETNRRVPKGLEMGPFSILDDAAWRALIGSAPCALAALSGYTFAIDPPVCTERPVEQQMEYWCLLKDRYRLVEREEDFGQNSTTLLILKRK